MYISVYIYIVVCIKLNSFVTKLLCGEGHYGMEVTFDPNLQAPFTCLIIGPTMSGKTIFTKTLIENADKLIYPRPQRIVWCYGEFQPLYEEIMKINSNIEFVEGFPDELYESFSPSINNLLILDDLMAELGSDKRLANLFTKGSHHRNLSIIHIQQNLFPKSKDSRTISLNSHYLVVFKNPRDSAQIMQLGKQMFPRNSQHLLNAYKDATSVPHGYLLVDLKQSTPEKLRLRTNILHNDEQTVYVPV